MNKQDLVDAVARRLTLSRSKAGEIVNLLFAPQGLIGAELRKGGKVRITGFGNFEVRRRAPRSGRNPQTGKTIHLKASIAPAFRPGKALKDVVNRKR